MVNIRVEYIVSRVRWRGRTLVVFCIFALNRDDITTFLKKSFHFLLWNMTWYVLDEQIRFKILLKNFLGRLAITFYLSFGHMLSNKQKRAIRHLLFVHCLKSSWSCTFRLVTNETIACQLIIVAFDSSWHDFTKLGKHFMQFLVISTFWQILNVEIVKFFWLSWTILMFDAFFLVLMVSNFNSFAHQFGLVLFFDNIIRLLFWFILDVAKTTRLAVLKSLKFKRLNFSEFTEVFPQILLR